jgi:hypothetical protein
MVDKLRRLRWAGLVARIGEHNVRISFGVKRRWKEKRDRGWRIILKINVSEIISGQYTIREFGSRYVRSSNFC